MNDTSREAFEKWAKTEGYSIKLNPAPRYQSVYYHEDDTEDAWNGYQAAQAEQAKQEPVYLGYDKWANVFHPLTKDKKLMAGEDVTYADGQELTLYTSPPNQDKLIAELQEDRNRLDAKIGQDSYDIGYSFAKQESASIISELVELLSVAEAKLLESAQPFDDAAMAIKQALAKAKGSK